MKNYSEFSDLEINIMVSKSLYGELSNLHEGELNEGVIDYCNKAEDAWPIIVDYKIGITPPFCLGGNWESMTFDSDGYVEKNAHCRNPIRASMIVYLMMKESENENSK